MVDQPSYQIFHAARFRLRIIFCGRRHEVGRAEVVADGFWHGDARQPHQVHRSKSSRLRCARSQVGARGQCESTRAMGGKNAKRTTASGKASRARSRDGGPSKAALYKRARAKGIENRLKMSKRQLENALGL